MFGSPISCPFDGTSDSAALVDDRQEIGLVLDY
jgi:hypothetical protein